MKRLALTISALLVLAALTITGCADSGSSLVPGEGEEAVNSCVTCHTDKEILKAVAAPEVEETSESTSGEG